MQKKRQKQTGYFKNRSRVRLFIPAVVLAGLLACAVLPALAQAERLCFPLQTMQYRISDSYGWREDPFTGEKTMHKGIDLACAEGTAVLAAGDGIVLQAKRSDSYGNCLRILHPDESETLYAHLQYICVRAGEVVCAGQTIGTAGQSGRATGAHLHFELWERGEICDPSAALKLPNNAS